MQQRHTNTFSGGMAGDIDPLQQAAGTYRDARNLRLLYNTGTDTLDGRSMALEPLAGTLPAYDLPRAYRFLGSIDSPLGQVVFSTNGTFSEIGVATDTAAFGAASAPASGLAYHTLFNDAYDPNGERLNLHLAPHLQARVVTENSAICRLYWADGRSSLRVANLRLATDAVGHTLHAGRGAAAYPAHWSVHNFDLMPRVQWGQLLFHKRIAGSLLSGQYQVTVRYRTLDGHASPWMPLSRPVFVTDQPMPASNAAVSHHRRFMGASGLSTTEGLRFVLDGLDRRWHRLEVALLYHTGSVGYERARLVKRLDLATLATDRLDLDLTEFSGTALSQADLTTANQPLEAVQTFAIANNVCYAVGVTLPKTPSLDVSGVTHQPVAQAMLADTTGAPAFTRKQNPDDPTRWDGDALTGAVRHTTTLEKTLFIDKAGKEVTVKLPVEDDYLSNKGQQICHSFVGYRRGETYPFALLARDTRGVAYYAQPLGEITMPTWAAMPPSVRTTAARLRFSLASGFSLSTSQYNLQSLGVRFDNIRLPYGEVWDEHGNLRIGSLEIVRGEPIGRLGFQAVAVNCTVNAELSDAIESDKRFRKIEPHASWNNAFSLTKAGMDGAPTYYASHKTKVTIAKKSLFEKFPPLVLIPGGAAAVLIDEAVEDKKYDTNHDTINKAYWVTLHAPDLLTTGQTPEVEGVRLQWCGAAHRSTSRNEIRMEVAPEPVHVYTKNYKTNGQGTPGAEGRPQPGDITRVKTWFRHIFGDRNRKYGQIDADHSEALFDPIQGFFPEVSQFGFNGTTQQPYRGRGSRRGPDSWHYVDGILQPGALVAKLQDWPTVDVIESSSSYVSLGIVNELKAATPQPAADERTYQPTGYFLPISPQVLAQMPTETDNAGGIAAYILSGAEVFGGDTYVNLVDFARIYPLWAADCGRRAGYTTDYGIGHIVPMESRYNYALMGGRRLARHGFYSGAAACENEESYQHAQGGVSWASPEDWNFNDVLAAKETVSVYAPRPADIREVAQRPYSVYASEPKVYGERDDSFRQFRVRSFHDLEGTKGPVVRAETLGNAVLIWQTGDMGRLRTYDRTLIPTTAGEVATGTGKVLDGIDYLGGGAGLQQFAALAADGAKIYWIDGRGRKLLRFSGGGREELSEQESAHDLFDLLLPKMETAPLAAALGIEPRHGEVYVTFGTGTRHTLLFNEKLSQFTGRADLTPYAYAAWRGRLFAVRDEAMHELSVGARGHFFGEYFRSEVEWVVNPAPLYPKVFDNLKLIMDGREALVMAEARTEARTYRLDLRTGADRRVAWRHGRAEVPLMEPSARERLRDYALRVRLTIDPTLLPPAGRFVLTAAETLYRLANRI